MESDVNSSLLPSKLSSSWTPTCTKAFFSFFSIFSVILCVLSASFMWSLLKQESGNDLEVEVPVGPRSEMKGVLKRLGSSMPRPRRSPEYTSRIRFFKDSKERRGRFTTCNDHGNCGLLELVDGPHAALPVWNAPPTHLGGMVILAQEIDEFDERSTGKWKFKKILPMPVHVWRRTIGFETSFGNVAVLGVDRHIYYFYFDAIRYLYSLDDIQSSDAWRSTLQPFLLIPIRPRPPRGPLNSVTEEVEESDETSQEEANTLDDLQTH